MFKKILLLFSFTLLVNSFVYAFIGPHLSSTLYSNPAWVPNSDKIAYFELIDYGEAKIETKETYKLELVLNIQSIGNPLLHEKITWIIPKEEWPKYQSAKAHFSFSPKADKIVLSIGSDTPFFEKGDIYIVDLKDNSKFQKIVENGINPEWSPDEDIITYESIVHENAKLIDPKENRILFIDNTGRTSNISVSYTTGAKKQIIAGVGHKPKWSSDGNKIVFSATDQIFIADKAGKSIEQIKIPFEQIGEPALSPDMTKVLFCKYRYEENLHWLESNLYIADLSGKVTKAIIKPNGVCHNDDAPIFDPVWSPDEEYIAYIYNCSANALFVIKKDGSDLKLIFNNRSEFLW